LNPNSVETFDELAKILNSSRSEILRDVLDRVAREYKKLIKSVNLTKVKNNPLLRMAGYAKSPSGRVSQNIDEIYLKD